MNRFFIYTPSLTARISYIFELIFNQILNLEQVEITTDLYYFTHLKNVGKLNYSSGYISNVPFIYAEGLLQQKTIENIRPSFKTCRNLPAAFFPSASDLKQSFLDKAALPFDPFALAFYLVSRYEEYLDFQADQFERFRATQSVAHQNRFLQRPLVNLWALELKKILLQHYPQLEFKPTTYQYIPSYDIDYAFAFLQKGFWRQLGAFGRNIKNRDRETLGLQLKTWLRLRKDPYDTFGYMDNLQKKYELSPIYFWLVGDYGTYDKNINANNAIFQKIIQTHAQRYPTGIHPSFGSQKHQDIVDKEIHRLEKISPKPVYKSRQHFLILKQPETYQRLVNLRMQEDYTMGYAERIGFRASIATPFYWYNLKEEKTTSLLIHPFQLMDVTFNTYLKRSPEEVVDLALPIIEQTKAVGGQLISIWHNSSLCEAWQWKGWRKVYERLIEAALP